jgi:hypothetical protein
MVIANPGTALCSTRFADYPGRFRRVAMMWVNVGALVGAAL